MSISFVTLRNLKQARELSGLLRAAVGETTTTFIELPIPVKYNLPAIIKFLETGVITDAEDIPLLLNAANYWDIPVLIRFCVQVMMGRLSDAATSRANATFSQRRQFIELMHRKERNTGKGRQVAPC